MVASSRSWSPSATRRPSTRYRTRSARAMVASREATTTVVVDGRCPSRPPRMAASVTGSTLEGALQADVVGHRGGEQERLLEGDRGRRRQLARVHLGQVAAAEPDPASLGL